MYRPLPTSGHRVEIPERLSSRAPAADPHRRFRLTVVSVLLLGLVAIGLPARADDPAPEFKPPWTQEKVPQEVKDKEKEKPLAWCEKKSKDGFPETDVTYNDPKTGTTTTIQYKTRPWGDMLKRVWVITIQTPGKPEKKITYDMEPGNETRTEQTGKGTPDVRPVKASDVVEPPKPKSSVPPPIRVGWLTRVAYSILGRAPAASAAGAEDRRRLPTVVAQTQDKPSSQTDAPATPGRAASPAQGSQVLEVAGRPVLNVKVVYYFTPEPGATISLQPDPRTTPEQVVQKTTPQNTWRPEDSHGPGTVFVPGPGGDLPRGWTQRPLEPRTTPTPQGGPGQTPPGGAGQTPQGGPGQTPQGGPGQTPQHGGPEDGPDGWVHVGGGWVAVRVPLAFARSCANDDEEDGTASGDAGAPVSALPSEAGGGAGILQQAPGGAMVAEVDCPDTVGGGTVSDDDCKKRLKAAVRKLARAKAAKEAAKDWANDAKDEWRDALEEKEKARAAADKTKYTNDPTRPGKEATAAEKDREAAEAKAQAQARRMDADGPEGGGGGARDRAIEAAEKELKEAEKCAKLDPAEETAERRAGTTEGENDVAQERAAKADEAAKDAEKKEKIAEDQAKQARDEANQARDDAKKAQDAAEQAKADRVTADLRADEAQKKAERAEADAAGKKATADERWREAERKRQEAKERKRIAEDRKKDAEEARKKAGDDAPGANVIGASLRRKCPSPPAVMVVGISNPPGVNIGVCAGQDPAALIAQLGLTNARIIASGPTGAVVRADGDAGMVEQLARERGVKPCFVEADFCLVFTPETPPRDEARDTLESPRPWAVGRPAPTVPEEAR